MIDDKKLQRLPTTIYHVISTFIHNGYMMSACSALTMGVLFQKCLVHYPSLTRKSCHDSFLPTTVGFAWVFSDWIVAENAGISEGKGILPTP
jgi:hypothetical protein